MSNHCEQTRLVLTGELYGSPSGPMEAEAYDHLSSCEDCLDWIADVHSMQLLFTDERAGKNRPRSSSRVLWLALAGAVLIGVFLGVREGQSPLSDNAEQVASHGATCEILFSQARHVELDRAELDLGLLQQELDSSGLEVKTVELLSQTRKGPDRDRLLVISDKLAKLRSAISKGDAMASVHLIRADFGDTRRGSIGVDEIADPTQVEYNFAVVAGGVSTGMIDRFADGRAALYRCDYANAKVSFVAAAVPGQPYYDDALYWASYCAARLDEFPDGIDFALRSARGRWSGPETAQVVRQLCIDAGAIVGNRSAQVATLAEVIEVLEEPLLQLVSLEGVYVLGGAGNELIRSHSTINRDRSSGAITPEVAKQRMEVLMERVRAIAAGVKS